ncbi:hypothetical protein DRH29_03900 [candidate division Kazan bacterium]|uniref:Uncharacterized protein n=1 Tax=candidate division Kazan bacterium TaxID=2202143 RepID=A0A420ZBS5_UNCK3|nr:MAG: hypothetical protein DRH29_03900 [candidate division Kazan bacterium]
MESMIRPYAEEVFKDIVRETSKEFLIACIQDGFCFNKIIDMVLTSMIEDIKTLVEKIAGVLMYA